MRRSITLLAVIALSLLPAAAQPGEATGSQPTPANPMSGKQLFSSYCSMCHGADGKGGGPYSTQLKTWPPDLTQLARRNGGVFPAMRIAEVIGGEVGKSSHGSREMPIWGPVFRAMAHGREDSAQRRINNLVKFLDTIQQK